MRNGIRTRLTLAFVGLAVGPLLLIGIILIWQSFATQQQQALNLQREVARRISVQVTAFFKGLENELRLTSRVQRLVTLDRNGQHGVLSELLAYQDVFGELALLDVKGQEQIRLSRYSIITDLRDRSQGAEFAALQTADQTYYSPIRFDKTTGEPLMVIAMPLPDLYTGQIGGILVSEVRVKKIWDLIADVQVSPGQSVYIVNAQGQVVAHRDPSVVLRGTSFRVPDKAGIQPGLDASRVVLAVDRVSVGEQEFNVVAEQMVSKALALSIDTVRITVILVVAALVVSGVLGFLAVRQIVRPIQAMAAAARAISAGDLYQQVEVTRQDELGSLAVAFNRMTTRLRQSLESLEQRIVQVKQAEEEFKKLADMNQTILDTVSVGIVYVINRKMQWTNKTFLDMFGFDPDDALGADTSILYADEAGYERIGAEGYSFLTAGKVYTTEVLLKRKNGQRFWINLNGKAVDSDKPSEGSIWMLQDITERKRAEAQLERNLRETRVRFEVSQALAGQGTEDEVLDVLIQHAGLDPQAFASIVTFDKTEGGLVGTVHRRGSFESSLGSVPPANVRFSASQYPLLFLALSAGRSFVSNDVLADERVDPGFLERSRQTGTGSLIAVPLAVGAEWMGFIFALARPTGYFDDEKQHLYQTLAEQGAVALRAARLRETIRESQQRLALLVQQSPLPVIEWNKDFQVVLWNPGAERIFGYTRQEALGCHATSLIVPEQMRSLVDQAWQTLLAQKGGTYSINENVTKDGRSITCEWFNAPLVDAANQVLGVVSLVQDITERRRAEAEREALIAELEAKNAELERFTYTVSHDLKSPLITIGGFVGFLEQDALTGNTERVKADMARINDAVAKMQCLLSELLELSRIGRRMNPPEEIPFAEIAREAVELVQGHIAARGVEVETASDLPVVHGDRARLVEVVQNLVDNACKFMGDQPHPRVEIGARQEQDEVVFYVRDNGMGIEPRYHDKVFGLFEKLDPQSEGAGVGLALVKRIIETHGGKIWVESAGKDQGSTFCFTLRELVGRK